MEEVVETESALASFAALPGIKPNNALRQVKHSLSLSRRTFVIKPFHVYEWSSPHDVKIENPTLKLIRLVKQLRLARTFSHEVVAHGA